MLNKNYIAVKVPLFIILVHGWVYGSNPESMNLHDIVLEARIIFQGTCTRIEETSVLSRGGGVQIPAMRFTFEVVDILKGELEEIVSFLQLGTPDGRADIPVDSAQIGIPKYRSGQTYLLFLCEKGPSGLTSPCGHKQGMFVIENGLAYHGISNAYIFDGLGLQLGDSKYSRFLEKALRRRSGGLFSSILNGNQAGLDVDLLKDFIRDMLRGEILTLPKGGNAHGAIK